MKRSNVAMVVALAAASLGLAACSEQTQENGKAFAEGAAADTAANAEVVGEKLEEATVVAADKVSEASADLRDDVQIMVGGAPVTQEFADDMGSDGYGKDAMDCVTLAKRLLGLEEIPKAAPAAT